MDKNAHIAIFMRTLKKGGGAQKAMARLASGLRERGYRVSIITLVPGSAFDDDIGLDIERVVLAGGRLAFAVPAIASYLRRHRPTTLFSTEPASNIVSILAALLARTETKVVIREGLYPSVARSESPHRSTRLAYRAAPYLYRYADEIIAIASDMARDLSTVAKLDATRIKTIAVNPVVTSSLLEKSLCTPPHDWLNDGGSPVILGVGRFSKQKDFITLIKAFNYLRATRSCRLLLIGDGEERQHLKDYAMSSDYSADIDFPGFYADPYSSMRACAAFVLSSRYEGLPNVLIEALACGAPVVSTDCPSGPRDILKDGKYGLLVPVGDHLAMAQGIAQVLDHPTLRSTSIQRGMDFTVSNSVNLYLKEILPHTG